MSHLRRTTDAKRLYTEKVNTYVQFSSVFLSAQALQAFFESSDLIRPDLRVLDAGCGTGLATFALLRILRRRGLPYRSLHGFDLTPAMLARFRETLAREKISGVQLAEADVLNLDALPGSWANYDLIVCASMLEYVRGVDVIPALTALRNRLARHGCLLVVTTRKNWMNKLLIEKWWQATGRTRAQLRESLAAAGFEQVAFRKFPRCYFWQNFWGHIVKASA